jgi:hypothetical protein
VTTEPTKAWADRIFGSDAVHLRQAIASALTDAYTRSRDAQDVSGAKKLNPFGHTLATLQYQLLAEEIEKALPGRCRIEKLDQYELVVVNNYVLYPLRSADPRAERAKDGVVRKPLSKLRRRMFIALGPKPHQEVITPELEPDEPSTEDVRALIARLGKGTRLAAISYVCRIDTGVTDVYLGAAELNARDGSLYFHDGENLPVITVQGSVYRAPRIANASTEDRSRAFDRGAPPEIKLESNPSHQTPIIEPEPPQPLSDDEEE